MSQSALHPLDVGVALHLVDAPVAASYADLGRALGLSTSTVHASIKRLMGAGLLRQGFDGERAVNRHALLEFLTHGVRYAFPAVLGRPTRGVPTAHAGPAIADRLVADEAVVWSGADGQSSGPALEPLLPKAAQIAPQQPRLYALLSAVDALRLGRARERQLAANYLAQALRISRAAGRL